MSKYANYVRLLGAIQWRREYRDGHPLGACEQAAYEDGLEKGRQESRKRISELESIIDADVSLLKQFRLEVAGYKERISELGAELDFVVQAWLKPQDELTPDEINYMMSAREALADD